MPHPRAHLLLTRHISWSLVHPQELGFHTQGLYSRPLPLTILQAPCHRSYAPWLEYVPSEGASGCSWSLCRSSYRMAIVPFMFSSAWECYRYHNIRSVLARPGSKAVGIFHGWRQPMRKYHTQFTSIPVAQLFVMSEFLGFFFRVTNSWLRSAGASEGVWACSIFCQLNCLEVSKWKQIMSFCFWLPALSTHELNHTYWKQKLQMETSAVLLRLSI